MSIVSSSNAGYPLEEFIPIGPYIIHSLIVFQMTISTTSPGPEENPVLLLFQPNGKEKVHSFVGWKINPIFLQFLLRSAFVVRWGWGVKIKDH